MVIELDDFANDKEIENYNITTLAFSNRICTNRQ